MSLVVKTKPRNSQKEPLVIVVGTRVSKKATTRNLLKRRIRAIMRPVMKNRINDYVIIVKPETTKLTYLELKEEIESKIRY